MERVEVVRVEVEVVWVWGRGVRTEEHQLESDLQLRRLVMVR